VLGRLGEKLAAKHLSRNGYKVIYRNFRPRGGGEVDIVCRDKTADTLAFVEVKTRSSNEFADPASAVNREKRELIARGARAWLHMLDNPDIFFRFDIVEVLMVPEEKPEINVIKSAFTMPKPFHYAAQS